MGTRNVHILVILYSDQVVSDRTVSVSSVRRDKQGPGSGNDAYSPPVLEARPEVRHARAGWLVSAEASLLGVQTVVFSLCPHLVIFCARLVPLFSTCPDPRPCGSEPARWSLSGAGSASWRCPWP